MRSPTVSECYLRLGIQGSLQLPKCFSGVDRLSLIPRSRSFLLFWADESRLIAASSSARLRRRIQRTRLRAAVALHAELPLGVCLADELENLACSLPFEELGLALESRLAVLHERGDAYGQESFAIENLPADQRGELRTLLVGQADRDQ
jgi:hypothetical protein